MWWQIYPVGLHRRSGPTRDRRDRDRRMSCTDSGVRSVAGPCRRPRAERSAARTDLRQQHRTVTTPSTTSGSTHGSATTATSTDSWPPRTERGIRILLDGVFNHVGRGHPAFQELVANGPPMPRPQTCSGSGTGTRLGTRKTRSRRRFRGPRRPHDARPRLRRRWSTWWSRDEPLARTADRRLAARRCLRGRRRRSGRGYSPVVRDAPPDAWFVGEVIHGDYPAIVAESTMDSLTQYELWQGIWHGIADRNFYELTARPRTARRPAVAPSCR